MTIWWVSHRIAPRSRDGRAWCAAARGIARSPVTSWPPTPMAAHRLRRCFARCSIAPWTAALGAGLAIQDAIASLCDCAEYKAAYPDPGAFVDSLYQRVLHRAPDP